MSTYSITARNVDTGEFVEVVTNSAKVNQLVEKMKRSRNFDSIKASEIKENPVSEGAVLGIAALSAAAAAAIAYYATKS